MKRKPDRSTRCATVSLPCLALSLWGSPALAQAPADPPTQACVDAYQSTQELRLGGKVRLAREKAVICARDACPPAVRSGCTKWLRELIDNQPSIVIIARDGEKDVTDAVVTLDGDPIAEALAGRPIEVDPGKHVIKLARRGHPPIERPVVIVDGAKNRSIEFDFTPPVAKAAPAPVAAVQRGAPVPGIVFGGLALGFVGTFAVLAFSGARDLDRMHDTCGRTRTCLDADIQAVKVKLVTGDVFLAAAVASAGLGVGLTIRHFTGDVESPHARGISWSVTPYGAGAMTTLTLVH